MAVTSLRRSGLTNLIKYDRFTAGNESDFALIESITVGSGGASSVTFSNIPQGFQHLQLRGIFRNNQTTADERQSLTVRVNSDTGSNYTYHGLVGDGSSASSGAITSQTFMYPGYVAKTTAGSNEFAAVVLDLLDYANTSKNKTVRCLSGHDGNGDGQVGLFSGAWLSASAVSTLTLATTGNFVEHTSVSLYGIR